MSETLRLTIHVGAIILWMWSIAVAYAFGRQLRSNTETVLRYGELRIMLTPSAIKRILDDLGMIGMPKGLDFVPKKQSRRTS